MRTEGPAIIPRDIIHLHWRSVPLFSRFKLSGLVDVLFYWLRYGTSFILQVWLSSTIHIDSQHWWVRPPTAIATRPWHGHLLSGISPSMSWFWIIIYNLHDATDGSERMFAWAHASIAHVNMGTNFTWKCHWLCWHWSSDRQTMDDGRRTTRKITHIFHRSTFTIGRKDSILLATKWKEREKEETNAWYVDRPIHDKHYFEVFHAASRTTHDALPNDQRWMNMRMRCVCVL